MPVINYNNHLYAHRKGDLPPKEVLNAFDEVLTKHSKTPWSIVLLEGKYSATPAEVSHIAGVHPEGMNANILLDCLKAYFNRAKAPGFDYGEFAIWAEKPARELQRFERPAPDITGEGMVGKVLDETLLFMKSRGIEKAYIEMDGKRVGTLTQKYIQEFIG